MPSRRDAIAMSPEEIRAYLASQRRMIVVSNGPQGLPHPVPMNYGLDGQDRIIITSFRKSQKVRNLERDRRASLLVESRSAYRELRAVIIYADAELITDPHQIAEAMQLIQADDSMTASMSNAMSEQVRESLAKRVAIRFAPRRYVSWDHSRLAGHY